MCTLPLVAVADPLGGAGARSRANRGPCGNQRANPV